MSEFPLNPPSDTFILGSHFSYTSPMTASFTEFTSAASRVRPIACVVLGSGLGDVASEFRAESTVAYADVPGLVPPSIKGHKGQMSVGYWRATPAVVCYGRVHFYEGHPWERV